MEGLWKGGLALDSKVAVIALIMADGEGLILRGLEGLGLADRRAGGRAMGFD